MNIRKHDRFWFDDGNVALVAHDGLAFRLHRGVLSLHSDVFQSLFAFPSRIEDNEMLENCPVVHLQDTGEDLAIFFALLYDGGKRYVESHSSCLRVDTFVSVPFFGAKHTSISASFAR